MKIKLSKKQKDDLTDIINTYTIISVLKDGKEIWNCAGKETKLSQELKITADCRIYVKSIVVEILEYLGKIFVVEKVWKDIKPKVSQLLLKSLKKK